MIAFGSLLEEKGSREWRSLEQGRERHSPGRRIKFSKVLSQDQLSVVV